MWAGSSSGLRTTQQYGHERIVLPQVQIGVSPGRGMNVGRVQARIVQQVAQSGGVAIVRAKA